MGTSSGAYELNHKWASTRTSTLVYYRVNTRVQMFFFDPNTFVPVSGKEHTFSIYHVLF